MRYFVFSEFDSPDLPGSGERMDREFLRKLDEARDIAGIPFVINSGYRTRRHNDTLPGAVPDSAHTKGLAVDVEILNSMDRWKVVSSAIRVGIRRIGVGRTFVHLDDDQEKIQEVIWLY